MNARRRQRLFLVAFLVLGVGAVTAGALVALSENMDAFYPPADIVTGKAPVGRRLRAGGMVKEGSVERVGATLAVSFVLTDRAGSEFEVRYRGILPDLFCEGQGIMATGKLTDEGWFDAAEVLAKHDETYMPRELMDLPQGDAEGDGMGTPKDCVKPFATAPRSVRT